MIEQLDTTPRRATAPPKRWRNKWWLRRVPIGEGNVVWGVTVFPSREIAEQRTLEWIKRNADLIRRSGAVYLGPYPDA